MQVSVEKTSELSRKITVSIPEETVQEKMEAQFKVLTGKVKVDGFRPGKVPAHVVKKLYSDRVRSEVHFELTESSYRQALIDNDLVPVGQPTISFIDKPIDQGLEFTAEIEVYPEIALSGISEIEIKRLTSNVTEDDIDAMIEKLRHQKRTFNEISRPVQDGDRVTINFSGTSEGENFTDGKTENFQVEIGAGRMIPGFEDELKGLNAGDSKTFTVTFPSPYHSEKLAGKPAEFTVDMVKIEEPVLPEVNEDFIKSYGVEEGTVEAFRDDVRANMERQLEQSLNDDLKNNVFTALYENISITIPQTLVEQEADQLMKPYQEQAKRNNVSEDEMGLSREVFETQAKRRVGLGLILSEIMQQQEIKLDQDRVRQTIERIAQNYEAPEDVIQWYYSDKTRLREAEQMVLENQVLDWVLDHAKIIDETVAFNDVLTLND